MGKSDLAEGYRWIAADSVRSADFGHPTGGYQGILASSLPLGSCIGLPFIPFINDRFGRRWCIMFGSTLMIIGSLIQAFSINGKYCTSLTVDSIEGDVDQ